MMMKKRLLLVLCGLVVGAAIVAWAAESAPSNTVGFFTYQIETAP